MRVNDCMLCNAYVPMCVREIRRNKKYKGNAVVPQQVVKIANGYNLFHLGY